ncbi:hypothetical protein [Rickettsia endosymbiont of Ceutorhynchus obstrictus]|uniref:hypothetical protein n=2 Tax=unclassified Rickettsia TaxID=114295 RepID=UPI003132AC7D
MYWTKLSKMSFSRGNSFVAWLIIYRIMVIISTMSYRGLTHYCTNVEKRLCHAVTWSRHPGK